MAGKKFFGCGGPPQTRRSSRGEQEDDAGAVSRGVKRALKFGEVRCRQNEERRLSSRCLGRSPKIHTRQQQCRNNNPDKKALFHFMTARDDPPRIRRSAAGIESWQGQWRRRSRAGIARRNGPSQRTALRGAA